MWSEVQLKTDLGEIGVRSGRALIVHVSLRSIGQIEGGGETLLGALRGVLGETGTLLVPAFRDPHSPFFVATDDWDAQPADTVTVGAFAEIVRQHPDALRSHHPIFSFAAIGQDAEFLTRNAPFSYPLGAKSPIDRLHQLDGDVLLLGVDSRVNVSLHLAEIWADVPYIHRVAEIPVAPEQRASMRGMPGCRNGYVKIEPLLRQSRIGRYGYIGNAPSQLLRQRHVVSLAETMLRGRGSSLLCDDPQCAECAYAHKMLQETQPLNCE